MYAIRSYYAFIGIVLANFLVRSLENLNLKVKEFVKGKNIVFEKKNSKDEITILENTLYEFQESLSNATQLKDIAEDKVQIALKIFEQSLEGILITDKFNKIILVNKAFTRITGYTQEEIYEKDPSILSSGNNSKEFYEKMWDDINVITSYSIHYTKLYDYSKCTNSRSFSINCSWNNWFISCSK